ncbi:MAG: hypothetical protein KF712_09840 [Akkermansiaceae bacterium]|nr:hypothetical protein [Akkermansiaceae bacterium]
MTVPLFGFLLAATAASHAAGFRSYGFAGAYPAEYGSSGVLTIAGGGASIHGSGVVNWGGLSKSGSGSLELSSGNIYTGEVILSTGSLSGFSDSLGSLTLTSGSLLLFGNSSTTDWGTWSHLSWTGADTGEILWLGENQLELSTITFIDPNFLSSGSLSVITYQGINYDITGWTPVPEPSGGMLAIAGGAVLLTGRRRFRGTALPDGARSA